MGVLMMGPKPFLMSHSIPIEGSGVRMSLNMMTPSGWNALQGCKDSSVAMSAFSDRSLKPSLSEYLDSILLITHTLDRIRVFGAGGIKGGRLTL